MADDVLSPDEFVDIAPTTPDEDLVERINASLIEWAEHGWLEGELKVTLNPARHEQVLRIIDIFRKAGWVIRLDYSNRGWVIIDIGESLNV